MQDLFDRLNNIPFETLNTDCILDGREDISFDSEWIRVYNELERLKCSSAADNAEVRKKAFITVFELSCNDELAGYISDDFGMIADSITLGYRDMWLDKLISCYRNSTIPCGML